MYSITAYCGLICESCPIHLATLETDKVRQSEMRVLIADQLSKIYGTTPKPDIITDCDGCRVSDGRLFTGCADCEIRKCANLKKMINCAYCSDYACDSLKRHFVIDPGSRERLDEIRLRRNKII